MTNLPDSGAREQFSTGAVREVVEDRTRPELISPHGLRRLGLHYARGAKKYELDNWAKGLPYRNCLGSMFRHLIAYMLRDDSEDHLAAIAWNAFAIMHFEEEGRSDELDDRPHYKTPEETK